MFNVNEKYDVVLTYSPINEITGHLFECFDYYLFLKKKYNVGLLFFGGMSKEKIKKVFESKYIDDFSEVEKDITFLDESFLHKEKMYLFGKNTVVILCDGNIHQLQLYGIKLVTRKLLGFMCGVKNEAIATDSAFYKNIRYLKDYRIYNDGLKYKTYDYVKKIPFDHYKKTKGPNKNIGMMYVTFACRKITPEVVLDYHEKSGCSKTMLVVPKKLEEYENLIDIEQVEAPVENFFGLFDKYIYTPVQRKFDCSPRLLTECFFQGKEVMLDLPYVDIGLKTRYDDCKNDFESLILKDNDKIIEIIEETKNGN